MVREEGVSGAEMDPSYRAWLESNPVPGEVFVDTGEASAADSRKLRWSPTKAQREMIKKAIAVDVAMVDELYENETQDLYAGHLWTCRADLAQCRGGPGYPCVSPESAG